MKKGEVVHRIKGYGYITSVPYSEESRKMANNHTQGTVIKLLNKSITVAAKDAYVIREADDKISRLEAEVRTLKAKLKNREKVDFNNDNNISAFGF